jgi:iron complex transport system substrate-binding protein
MRVGVTLLAGLALTIAASGGAQPAAGGSRRQPDSTKTPTRIVSLVPALTEMLFAIGAGAQVVGVSSYDKFPAEAASRPRVGALLDPNVEHILALTPDLVATYGSQVDLKQQLQRASIAVYDYRHAGLPDILTTLRDLGRVTGHVEEADAVAAGIERRLEAVRRRVSGRRPVRTLLVFGREAGGLRNVYASGGRGFLHDMLTLAGGENVLADVARESVQATTELILTRAPDVILEVREGPERSEAERRAMAADWARLSTVPAVKSGRVLVVSGDGLVVPGPRVAAAVERFAAALHPEAAR